MNRRNLVKGFSLLTLGIFIPVKNAISKTYLTLEQAKNLLTQGHVLIPSNVTLSKSQMNYIEEASQTWVRHSEINAWVTKQNDWFIVDQVIGKHEFIDFAIFISNEGKVLGLEILTYRESYGDEIRHPKWLAQFKGRNASMVLKLDEHIKNISGATLSCRHMTDGVNRLVHTWEHVLQHVI